LKLQLHLYIISEKEQFEIYNLTSVDSKINCKMNIIVCLVSVGVIQAGDDRLTGRF
jgi:hypothetical protein